VTTGASVTRHPVWDFGFRIFGRRARPLGVASHALTVTALVVIITFALVRVVPGDPVVSIEGTKSSPEARAALRHQLHLDKPLPVQFELYVRSLVTGDLGSSLIEQGRPVSTIIRRSLPVTLSLVGATILLSCLIGIPLGLLAALREGPVDFAIRAFLTVLLALPPFFLGLLLILLFSIKLSFLPAGGWGTMASADLKFLVLPAVALAAFLIPVVARVCRQAARQALHEQWLEVAIARGLPNRRLTLFHVLPNSILPVVTLIGYNAGALLTGAVVVEAVFALPGIGAELVSAINTRDYPVIQGIALVSAVAVVAANLMADLVAVIIDPRSRRD
jgi:peptide/nickel transport system permease protein